MSVAKVFAGNVREERRRQKRSQEEVAFSSGLNRTEISRLERGLRDPRLSTIVKLASALKVPAGQLLEGLPPRPAAADAGAA